MVSDESFGSISLRLNLSTGIGNESFGMDNLSFATAIVPEPSSAVLSLTGLAACLAASRRAAGRA